MIVFKILKTNVLLSYCSFDLCLNKIQMTLMSNSNSSTKENIENPKNMPRFPPKLESKSTMPCCGASVICVYVASA